tara:strand:+ start:166 stop:399 length:234 start_codon:yes stop_codon:yes gene_type:complete
MEIKMGTSHFESEQAAVNYYYSQCYDKDTVGRDVMEKIERGEITIGPPELKDGERLEIIKGEGRYAIIASDYRPGGE